MTAIRTVEIHAPALEDEAAEVMTELREAMGLLVSGLTGPIHRAVDVSRALDLDKKLAWQVFRIAKSEHPLAEVQNLPAPSSVRRLLEAARKRRMPVMVVDRLEAAFARLDEFTQVHAGDRESLVSVLSGLGGRSDDQYEIKNRKLNFRTAAHAWGIHARMLVRTSIFHAKPGPEHVEDSALIQASIGLQRVRASQSTDLLMMMRTRSESPADGPKRQPVHHPAELLHKFCAGPLPQLSADPGEAARGETKLRLPPGRTGAATLYSMQLHECLSLMRQSDYYGRTLVTVPTETIVWELLAPAGWTDPTSVRAAMYGCREHAEKAFEERPQDLLRQQESVEYLGTLESVPNLDGSPRHAAAVRHVLEKLGWLDTRYDVYRCRVQYPLLHTMLALRVDATTK